MAVVVKKLEGSAIPAAHRRPGLDALYEVTSFDGTVRHYVSEVEAAHTAAELNLKDRERKP